MAKLLLTDPASLSNEASFLAQLAANNAAIEEVIERAVLRDSVVPDHMLAELDMNSNAIINLPAAATNTEPVRKAEFDDLEDRVDILEADIAAIDASVAAAAASAIAALASQVAAASSATSSASSATASAASAAAALATLDDFDDLYLGAHAADPTLDNDGDPLVDGALYFNTVSNVLKVYDLGTTAWVSPTAGVASFEGRVGVVVSVAGDYTATEITNTPAGTIAATNVQTALNELDTDKVATSITITAGAGLTGGGDLSANRTITVGAGIGIIANTDDVALDINSLTADATPDITADYVATFDASASTHKKVLLNKVGGVTSFETRTGAVTSASGDYTASEITNVPAGAIAAVTVQAAIDELDTEKLASSAYTAADVLSKLLTVDGAGSGLDADLLDGSSSAAFQPVDATLTALAGLNTTAGVVVQTGTDTFTKQTLAGTANQITMTNGDGVSGAPTVSLPADVIIPTVLTVPNTGLHILDTNASHDLIVKPGSDITADRTLTLTTGDTDMIVNLTAVTDEYVLGYDTGTNTWRGVAGGAGGGGLILQVLQTTYATAADLNTALPYDDTVPTSSEGVSVLSQAITPTDDTNKVLVCVSIQGVTESTLGFAVFRGSTCIVARAMLDAGVTVNPDIGSADIIFYDSPASASSQTYSVRAGATSTAALVGLNATISAFAIARRFGGASVCTLTLMEVAV